jgi:hypothetical protein
MLKLKGLSADSTLEANLPRPAPKPRRTFALERNRMATTVREFSLDYYLLDRLKFSGLEKENLHDLVSIIISLKNKYGIAPLVMTPHGDPVPIGLTLSYIMDSITMNKLLKVLLDTPRLSSVTVAPRGIPHYLHFDVKVTFGG